MKVHQSRGAEEQFKNERYGFLSIGGTTMVSTLGASAPRATRLAFWAAGFGIACWAPLVPFAQERLRIEEGELGLLLLCLGAGAVLAMPLTGILSSVVGSKPIIVAGGLGLALFLPFLAAIDATILIGGVLFLFGASLGSIDVAMNIHAVEVEKQAGRALMSGFHALFSIGGFMGAGMMTVLLSIGIAPTVGATLCALLVLAAIIAAVPGLQRARQDAPERLVALPRGIVPMLSVLALIVFLAEGAVLDWGALYLVQERLAGQQYAGVGYMSFAIAMTIGRLSGDAISNRYGDQATLFWSGWTAVAGLVLLLSAPSMLIALAGFLLLGFGAANIVPVLFRFAGSQSAMSPNLAVATVTTIGYAGILIGPAGVGFIAQLTGLTAALWTLAILLCAVPFSVRLLGTAKSRKPVRPTA